MSWRLILSEYPESLFRDSRALLVLALLERAGAQTEDDLAQQTNSEKPLLSKALLALHRDRCVEYTRDFVRLTERGREFIDRLSLQDEIVEDVLHWMRIPTEERQPLRDVLLRYRSRSYRKYIDSLTAIRTWDHVCRRSFLATEDEHQARESGALAILIRDMRKWLLAEPEPSNAPAIRDMRDWLLGEPEPFDAPAAIKRAESTYRRLLLERGAVGKSSFSTHWLARARAWCDTYDDLGRAANPWDNLPRLRSPHLVVFCAHEYSRDLDDLTNWVHDWTSPKGKWLLVLDACSSAGQFVSAAQDNSQLAVRLGRWDKRALIHHEGVFSRFLRQSVGELLTNLFHSNSIHELSERTNSEEGVLRHILESLRTQSEKLLGTAGGSTAQEGAKSEREEAEE